jgi:S-adenosylhomocysteine hydrolase
MVPSTRDIADEELAEAGRSRIDWAAQDMPMLRLLRQRFATERPLEGVRIGGCLRITTETAVLAEVLKTGGAEVALCASNPLSTLDVIITATGNKNVIDGPHFAEMIDGCILANSGHFDVKVNVRRLREMAIGVSRPRDHAEEFVMPSGRRIRLLAEGRLVNLAAAEGHPAAVTNMNFANQALSVVHIWANRSKRDVDVHPVPAEIDREVAQLKLKAMRVRTDELTDAQAFYLVSWRDGT